MTDSKGVGRGLIEVLSRYLPGVTEETQESNGQITDVPAEIRKENVPNTTLKSYRNANPFGGTCFIEPTTAMSAK
jgi:hypothetical protein